MSKVILVTGSNTGIGFELVRLLAEKGHTVYLAARNESAGIKAVCVYNFLYMALLARILMLFINYLIASSCTQRGLRLLNLCALM